MMQRILFSIDRLSAWSGKITSWIVLLMTLLISFDITMRYLSKPIGEPIFKIWFTYTFSYDMSYYLYAILFMLGGAVRALARQHVRGDIFYRTWPVRVQAASTSRSTSSRSSPG
jgi:TRAP-type mannitol/chloroaromatic compound transport system permease small subunit